VWEGIGVCMVVKFCVSTNSPVGTTIGDGGTGGKKQWPQAT